jgi:hypothetical protein
MVFIGLNIIFFGRKSTYWTLYHAKNCTPLLGVIEDYTEQIPPKRIIITENYPKSHNNTRTLGLYSFRAFSLLTVKFKKCMDIKQTNQK